jgi:hypothetical protein
MNRGKLVAIITGAISIGLDRLFNSSAITRFSWRNDTAPPLFLGF